MSRFSPEVQALIDQFHILFYKNASSPEVREPRWNGVPIQKCPFDLFNYQEILSSQKPDYIIECGAYRGGSTLFFANLCDMFGKGKVISIDICERAENWNPKTRKHDRVICIAGSSTDLKVLKAVEEMVADSSSNFVILDSLHTKQHVLEELRAYSRFLFPGNYIIVEDSNLNGHPLPPEMHRGTSTGGPYEAAIEFLAENDKFEVDRHYEDNFLFSYAPSGYLFRKPR